MPPIKVIKTWKNCEENEREKFNTIINELWHNKRVPIKKIKKMKSKKFMKKSLI